MAARGMRTLARGAQAVISIGALPRGVASIALVAGAAAGGLTLGALIRWPPPSPIVLLVGGAGLLVAALLVAATASLPRAGARRRDGAGGRVGQAAVDAAVARMAIASVAHDIRSPLVTVHSYLELLAEDAFGPLPADARRAAQRATHAAGLAQSLVDEALREQALHSATRPLELGGRPAEAVDLRLVVEDVIASLEVEFAAAQAEVEVLDLPPVRGSDTALYRVFANLLQDAAKYGGAAGGPRIVVSGVLAADRCEIAVRDWGPGVPSEEQERVFEPRVRGERVRGEAGTGTGLSTVRSLVTQQSGSVWVDPAVTDGTCIRLSLPAA